MSTDALTDKDIAEGLALCEAATEAPWLLEDDDFESGVIRCANDSHVAVVSSAMDFPCLEDEKFDEVDEQCRANMRLIAAARTGWPAALREVQQLRQQIAELAYCATVDKEAVVRIGGAVDIEQERDAALHREEALRSQLASNNIRFQEIYAERDAALDELKKYSPFERAAAHALADEVAAMVRRRELDARSPAADALLDFRNPPETERSGRIVDLEDVRANCRKITDAAVAERDAARAKAEQLGRAVQKLNAYIGWNATNACSGEDTCWCDAHAGLPVVAAQVAQLRAELETARALADVRGREIERLSAAGCTGTVFHDKICPVHDGGCR